MAINNALNLGTTPLPVTQGGLGINTVPTNGQLPVGNGTNYVAAAITAGSGITVTNGPGSISIATTGATGVLPYVGVAGTTQAAVVDTGYINQNAALTTITLPAIASLGSVVAVQGLGAGGWTLAANAGQTIHVGQTATTSGGSVSSANNYDAIQVICIVANTTWAMTGPVSSGFITA